MSKVFKRVSGGEPVSTSAPTPPRTRAATGGASSVASSIDDKERVKKLIGEVATKVSRDPDKAARILADWLGQGASSATRPPLKKTG